MEKNSNPLESQLNTLLTASFFLANPVTDLHVLIFNEERSQHFKVAKERH